MQWDSTKSAGFTTGHPWMSANPNFEVINAASQLDDPQSAFHCWKSVLSTRKQHKDIFVYGDFQVVDEPNENVLAYSRKSADGKIALVCCNFSPDTVNFESLEGRVSEILLTTAGRTLEHFNKGSFYLSSYEAVAVLLV